MSVRLTWNTPDQVQLSELSSINFKKPIVLTGDGYAVGPDAFYVRRHPRWPETTLRRIFKKDSEPLIGTYRRPSFDPPIAKQAVHLPRPPVWGSVCSFRDDYDNGSVRINVVRLGDVKLNTEGKPEWKGAALGKISIGVKVGMAIDPTVKVELLLPWRSRDLGDDQPDLYQHIDEISANLSHEVGEADHTINEQLRRILGDSLPTEAPRGWSFSVEPAVAVVEAAQSLPLTVTVLTPSPGISAFAIKVASTDDPTEEAVSDIAIVVAASPNSPPSLFVPGDWDEPPPIEQLSPFAPSSGSGRLFR